MILGCQNWAKRLTSKKDAELNNIFGETDGRNTDATQREAEARTETSGRRQNATNERKLATVREGDTTEDTRRESGQKATVRVSIQDTDPKLNWFGVSRLDCRYYEQVWNSRVTD
jgi:hypothetical protein